MSSTIDQQIALLNSTIDQINDQIVLFQATIDTCQNNITQNLAMNEAFNQQIQDTQNMIQDSQTNIGILNDSITNLQELEASS
jgi:chromosome segregation ATPase